MITCKVCNGNGFRLDKSGNPVKKKCAKCRGSGNFGYGICEECFGEGQVEAQCLECRGIGKVEPTRSVQDSVSTAEAELEFTLDE